MPSDSPTAPLSLAPRRFTLDGQPVHLTDLDGSDELPDLDQGDLHEIASMQVGEVLAIGPYTLRREE